MSANVISERNLDSPESEVLLAAVGTWLGTVSDDHLDRALQGEPDWGRVAMVAERHGLSPVVNRVIESSSVTVPESVSSDLKESATDVARRNLVLFDETCMLIAALREAGVRAVPYKGPVFAETLYGDLALRTSIDVDLLVRAADLEAATAVLSSRGYERHEGEAQFEQVFDHRASSHQRRFVRREPTLRVDLNWRFTAPRWSPSPLTDAALESVVPVEVRGRELNVLSPEMRFVVLCIHGSRHVWSRLAWLLDIALLARREDFDWERVMAIANDWHVGRMVLLGLAIVEELFVVALPVEVGERLEEDEALPGLVETVVDRLLPVPSEPSTAAQVWFHLRVADRQRDRLATLLKVAFVPTWRDVAAVRVPPRLSVLYYGVRPVRLCRRMLLENR